MRTLRKIASRAKPAGARIKGVRGSVVHNLILNGKNLTLNTKNLTMRAR